jgi:hypothetical protein
MSALVCSPVLGDTPVVAVIGACRVRIMHENYPHDNTYYSRANLAVVGCTTVVPNVYADNQKIYLWLDFAHDQCCGLFSFLHHPSCCVLPPCFFPVLLHNTHRTITRLRTTANASCIPFLVSAICECHRSWFLSNWLSNCITFSPRFISDDSWGSKCQCGCFNLLSKPQLRRAITRSNRYCVNTMCVWSPCE